MAKPRNKNQSTSTRKLVISFLVIIGIIFVVLYINKWHQVKEEEKYLNSYLLSTNTISLEMNDIDEISSVLSETPSKYFVYVSYTKDKDVYNFEKEIKPLIDKYSLQNSFYFLNITDIKKDNKNYKKDIAKKLNISENELNKIPTILYFKDGKLINGVTTAKDFKTLIENELKTN